MKKFLFISFIVFSIAIVGKSQTVLEEDISNEISAKSYNLNSLSSGMYNVSIHDKSGVLLKQKLIVNE